MSFDAYISDMEDNNAPPSLVDETSIQIPPPKAGTSSCSDGRSSPMKAPSLSSQSEIYISSDKDEEQSEREESTHNEDEDNTTQDEGTERKAEYFEQIRKLHKEAVERQEMSIHGAGYKSFGDEYFIPIKRFRKKPAKKEAKAIAKPGQDDTSSSPDKDFYRPAKRIRKGQAKINAKTDGEVLAARPDEEYFGAIKKLRMVQPRPEVVPSPPKPLTSFFIKDILNHKPDQTRRHSMTSGPIIVRPWDLGLESRQRPRSADDETRSEKSESTSFGSPEVMAVNASPLDALFEMTSKAFEGLDAEEKSSGKMIFLFIHFGIKVGD